MFTLHLREMGAGRRGEEAFMPTSECPACVPHGLFAQPLVLEVHIPPPHIVMLIPQNYHNHNGTPSKMFSSLPA